MNVGNWTTIPMVGCALQDCTFPQWSLSPCFSGAWEPTCNSSHRHCQCLPTTSLLSCLSGLVTGADSPRDGSTVPSFFQASMTPLLAFTARRVAVRFICLWDILRGSTKENLC